MVRHPNHEQGFTVLEAIVVFAAIVVFLLLALLPLRWTKTQAIRSHCTWNLKQIALQSKLYLQDHNNRFPWEAPTHSPLSASFVFQSYSNLSPELFHCPEQLSKQKKPDGEQTPTSSLYFAGIHGTNSTVQILAGDTHLEGLEKFYLPQFENVRFMSANNALGWKKTRHQGRGNLAIQDGHVKLLSSRRLRKMISRNQEAEFILMPK